MMQDLRNAIVGEHGELVYLWATRAWKDGVCEGRRRREERCPSFSNQDLGTLPEAD